MNLDPLGSASHKSLACHGTFPKSHQRPSSSHCHTSVLVLFAVTTKATSSILHVAAAATVAFSSRQAKSNKKMNCPGNTCSIQTWKHLGRSELLITRIVCEPRSEPPGRDESEGSRGRCWFIWEPGFIKAYPKGQDILKIEICTATHKEK